MKKTSSQNVCLVRDMNEDMLRDTFSGDSEFILFTLYFPP